MVHIEHAHSRISLAYLDNILARLSLLQYHLYQLFKQPRELPNERDINQK